ncbi:UDP-glucuronosyltransferase 2B7 isoform X1 [Agrilus planipennis]|uniref:UDP-glucuronosyltransferase n=1 Tax=Agrilus planipennis TaxID=224129 RepID=A0A1W4XHT9_AGRPL|nr:UDP-glucuronosyltransferase 2B7 isoform X1 [Agrilus planipennis]XP_018335698.1 UDP-glucuronosyltransferase 2B7 isoform X1 [Agrilus planipennis]
MKCLFVFCFVLFSARIAVGVNILAVFFTPLDSYQKVFRPLWVELSLRGHNVTVITTDPVKNESLVNLTEIDVSYSCYRISDELALPNDNLRPEERVKLNVFGMSLPAFEAQVQHHQIQDLLRDSSNRFDLVVMEMTSSPYYGFAYLFDVPWVGVLPHSTTLASDRDVGNLRHPLLFPDPTVKSYTGRNIWMRLYLALAQLRLIYSYDYEIMPELDRIARKYFGDDMPYLGDIEKNVSIILTTHNFITSKPKPTVPALIEIGNVHLKKNVKLPQDLQKELDKATNGVIYFSLGSNVKSANISSQLRNVIISSFAELPYTILWKWETDHLPGKPDNVITRKWLPQEAVLAHPNVKAFITQGGLQSMEEAIYYRKPLIGMPFFADQMKNVRSIAEHGIGVALNTDTLTKEKLKSAILEVVNDKKYKEKISELSDLMWDQPMSGLDTAIWWIEYVIRHKGAKHLRSPLLDLPLYQYLLLDVLAFVFGVIATTLGLLYAAYIYTKPVIQGVVGKNKVKSN